MVLALEPGIYVPGWGGVRLEDMVAVTASGARILTAAPRSARDGRF
jgi:Xaa-Pro aminopeptidase